jgi:hypothetical protein
MVKSDENLKRRWCRGSIVAFHCYPYREAEQATGKGSSPLRRISFSLLFRVLFSEPLAQLTFKSFVDKNTEKQMCGRGKGLGETRIRKHSYNPAGSRPTVTSL